VAIAARRNLKIGGASVAAEVLALRAHRSQYRNTSAIAVQTVAQNSRPATQTSAWVSRGIGASSGGTE